MTRTAARQTLRKRHNEILVGLTESVRSTLEVQRAQTSLLIKKVAARKKRRTEATRKVNGEKVISVLVTGQDYVYDMVLNEMGKVNGTNFSPIMAPDLPDVIAETKKHKFDVVLLACQLFDCKNCMNGGLANVIRKIKKSNRRCQVIVYSGRENHKCDAIALNAGASDFLSGAEVNAIKFEKSIRYCIKNYS